MKAFDVQRMAVSLLPTILRRPVVMAILRAALAPLQAVHDSLHSAHHGQPYGTLYRLAHSGQTASLETLLNDRFDPDSRRITVGEGDSHSRWWLYSENEIALQPYLRSYLATAANPTPLYPDADYADREEAGFVVRCPASLASSEASIRASVDDTRIAGTAYSVVFYS